MLYQFVKIRKRSWGTQSVQVGVIAYKIHKQFVEFGISLCSDKDQFDKTIGAELAISRIGNNTQLGVEIAPRITLEQLNEAFKKLDSVEQFLSPDGLERIKFESCGDFSYKFIESIIGHYCRCKLHPLTGLGIYN